MNRECRLVAVDVGLKTALAGFDSRGRVLQLQARRFSSSAVLRRAANSMLAEFNATDDVVLEGGGELTRIWEKNCRRRGLQHHTVHARHWRDDLLLPRERRSGELAKGAALELFTVVIDWSGLKGTYSQQHDAAEAVLCGFWWAWRQGWVDSLPEELNKRII